MTIATLLCSLVLMLVGTEQARVERASPGFHLVEVAGGAGAVKGAVYVPRGAEGPMPTIVFLHGYGECGTDGLKQLGVGLPNAIVWDEARWPFVVVIPQKPAHDTDWGTYEDAVLSMLDLAVERFGADPDRVGLTGLSQGGHGTIAIASRNPDRFRAAAPVCGYTKQAFEDGERAGGFSSTPEQFEVAAEGLKDLAVWIFHGEKDDLVPASESRGLHRALLDAAADDAELSIFPDDNHNSWDSAYRRSGLWDWFSDRLSDGED